MNSLCDEPKGHLRRRLASWDLKNFLFISSCICTCTKTAFHKHEIAALHIVKNWVNGEHPYKIHHFTHGFHAVGFKVLDSFTVSGTWILDSNRSGIPDFLKCIPDSFTWSDVLSYWIFLIFLSLDSRRNRRRSCQGWQNNNGNRQGGRNAEWDGLVTQYVLPNSDSKVTILPWQILTGNMTEMMNIWMSYIWLWHEEFFAEKIHLIFVFPEYITYQI